MLELLGYMCGSPWKYKRSLAAKVFLGTYSGYIGPPQLVLLQDHLDIIALLLQWYDKRAKGEKPDAQDVLERFGFTNC